MVEAHILLDRNLTRDLPREQNSILTLHATPCISSNRQSYPATFGYCSPLASSSSSTSLASSHPHYSPKGTIWHNFGYSVATVHHIPDSMNAIFQSHQRSKGKMCLLFFFICFQSVSWDLVHLHNDVFLGWLWKGRAPLFWAWYSRSCQHSGGSNCCLFVSSSSSVSFLWTVHPRLLCF